MDIVIKNLSTGISFNKTGLPQAFYTYITLFTNIHYKNTKISSFNKIFFFLLSSIKDVFAFPLPKLEEDRLSISICITWTSTPVFSQDLAMPTSSHVQWCILIVYHALCACINQHVHACTCTICQITLRSEYLI